MAFLDLPTDAILKIFDFCDIQSLCRLACTCRKFNILIDTEESIWRLKSRFALGSNMTNANMEERCNPKLSFKKRCEISKKWKSDIYTKSVTLKYKKCLPWLCLDKNYLFCSKAATIVQFSRDLDGNTFSNRCKHVKANMVDDVSKFVINDNELIIAGRDGSLSCRQKYDLQLLSSCNAHHADILSVASKNDIIISGSKDFFIKIWKINSNRIVFQKEINMQVRVLSTAIMPSNRYFVVGLPGVKNIHPLQLFNLERGEYVTKFGDSFRTGAGILDIYPECQNTFLACGYDTTIRLWDIRTPKNYVSTWMDPYDNGIYCVQSDHHMTIVSGAYRNGVFHVWDKRYSSCIKLYHSSEYNSPVYSVAFDASHIFVAFDRAVLQFSYL